LQSNPFASISLSAPLFHHQYASLNRNLLFPQTANVTISNILIWDPVPHLGSLSLSPAMVVTALSATLLLALSVSASPQLSIVAEVFGSENQLTGVAVSPTGRVFVNFPRWNSPTAISVAELIPVSPGSTNVTIVPYPNEAINVFNSSAPDAAQLAGTQLVCVQSVVFDANGYLWIMDTGSPYLAGVIDPSAPKLIKVDISNDTVLQVYHFDNITAPEDSYLNDVRFDEEKQIAYIADAKATGAIVIVDLKTGNVRRLLAGAPSTKQDPNFVAHIGDVVIQGSTGNSDGIALSRDKRKLFFQPLYANHSFYINTRYLLNEAFTADDLSALVVPLGPSPMTDGMDIDEFNRLYYTAIERFAITRCTSRAPMICEDVVQDPRIKWPDSFAWLNDTLYFTTSQIYLGPPFNNGTDRRTDPYRVWKIEGLVN
jgi:sugar lactone lactonase YvrE